MILIEKNLGNSHHVSVVGAPNEHEKLSEKMVKVLISRKVIIMIIILRPCHMNSTFSTYTYDTWQKMSMKLYNLSH